MTCIVGIKKDGVVYLGGDSAGVAGLDISIRRDTKIFHNGPMIMGYTTSFRMGQILRYSLKIPEQPSGMDDMEFMCTLFVDALMNCFKNKGWLKAKEGINEGGTFLVGYKGDLYKVCSDFQVATDEVPYMATGCGESYALGALFTLRGYDDMDPVLKLEHALTAASTFSAGVSAPFLYAQLPYKEALQ